MTSPVPAPRPARRRPEAPPNGPSRSHLRVVAPSTRRVRTSLVVGLATVVVFAALVAGAMVHSLLVSGQVHLDQVGADTRTEREGLETEQLRLAELQSPARITREARRLGMVPAVHQRWLSPGTDTAPVAAGSPASPTPGPDSSSAPAAEDPAETATAATGGEISPR